MLLSGSSDFRLICEAAGTDAARSTDAFKAKMSKDEAVLRRAGVDVDRAKRLANSKAQAVASEIKNEKDQVQASKRISESVKEIFDELDWADVPEALAVTFVIMIVNTLAMAVMSIILGPLLGMIVTAVVVAPITEEYGKNLSIKEGYSGTFFVVFNSMEFLSYVTNMVGRGFSLGAAAAIRLIPVIMHLTTTVVQKRIVDKGKGGAEASQSAAYSAGMLIHGFYNFFAVFA